MDFFASFMMISLKAFDNHLIFWSKPSHIFEIISLIKSSILEMILEKISEKIIVLFLDDLFAVIVKSVWSKHIDKKEEASYERIRF